MRVNATCQLREDKAMASRAGWCASWERRLPQRLNGRTNGDAWCGGQHYRGSWKAERALKILGEHPQLFAWLPLSPWLVVHSHTIKRYYYPRVCAACCLATNHSSIPSIHTYILGHCTIHRKLLTPVAWSTSNIHIAIITCSCCSPLYQATVKNNKHHIHPFTYHTSCIW